MPSHWHLLLWPRRNGELALFMQRRTTTHVRRWHTHRHSECQGHLYQGTYKSFPVQDDRYFLTVGRYVERYPLRARLCRKAENWLWSSLWRRERGSPEEWAILSDWPLDPPRNWLARVNEPQTDAEVSALREAVRRGRPWGNATWQAATARWLNLAHTFRDRGRPRQSPQRGKVAASSKP